MLYRKFKCEKCEGRFLKAAALGSHKWRKHGIKGTNSHANKAMPKAIVESNGHFKAALVAEQVRLRDEIDRLTDQLDALVEYQDTL